MTLVAHADSDSILFAPLTIETAILRAVLYADVFDYPLTVEEIHRYCVGGGTSLDQVRAALQSSAWLTECLASAGPFYTLAGRQSLEALRAVRTQHAARLWKVARGWGRLMARLPFVRMVAVTGALAMNNVVVDDDVDFLILTAPGRVWLTRAFAILVVRLARLTGARLCPNYLLATTALAQDRRDLFIAHELAQMVPVAGREFYRQMRAANAWVADYLPNAAGEPAGSADAAPGRLGHLLQQAVEWLLRGSPGDRMEEWERARKLTKFRPRMAREGSAAVLDESHVKGHFDDYGREALAAYAARCRQFQIDTFPKHLP
jgi:hypothetical protein